MNLDNTQIVLCGIQMTKATLYSQGQRYDIFFDEGK